MEYVTPHNVTNGSTTGNGVFYAVRVDSDVIQQKRNQLYEAVFSVWSVPRLYHEDEWGQEATKRKPRTWGCNWATLSMYTSLECYEKGANSLEVGFSGQEENSRCVCAVMYSSQNSTVIVPLYLHTDTTRFSFHPFNKMQLCDALRSFRSL
jgi:hypothetical protein